MHTWTGENPRGRWKWWDWDPGRSRGGLHAACCPQGKQGPPYHSAARPAGGGSTPAAVAPASPTNHQSPSLALAALPALYRLYMPWYAHCRSEPGCPCQVSPRRPAMHVACHHVFVWPLTGQVTHGAPEIVNGRGARESADECVCQDKNTTVLSVTRVRVRHPHKNSVLLMISMNS